MKTDETNLVKHEIPFVQRSGVSAYAGITSTHLKSPAERERDALDAWRDRQAEGRAEEDPIEIHQLDLDSTEPNARAALQAFTDGAEYLHRTNDDITFMTSGWLTGAVSALTPG